MALTCSPALWANADVRSEEHTSELQSRVDLVCRVLLEKKKPAGLGCLPCPRSGARLPQHRSNRPRRVLPLAKPRRLFFLDGAAPTATYTLPLHGALPI